MNTFKKLLYYFYWYWYRNRHQSFSLFGSEIFKRPPLSRLILWHPVVYHYWGLVVRSCKFLGVFNYHRVHLLSFKHHRLSLSFRAPRYIKDVLSSFNFFVILYLFFQVVQSLLYFLKLLNLLIYPHFIGRNLKLNLSRLVFLEIVIIIDVKSLLVWRECWVLLSNFHWRLFFCLS